MPCFAWLAMLKDGLQRLGRRFDPGPGVEVELDPEGVRCLYSGGKVEQVRWDDLEQVAVLTTDEGPWVEDVFWLLVGPDGTGCAVPQLLAPEGLLARIQELPGFDNEAFIRAMGSTDNATFVCWRRAA